MSKVKTSEQACVEIKAITEALNARVSYPKLVEERSQGKIVTKATGSFEVCPFSENEVSYLKACVLSLVNQYIDNGTLVRPIEKDEKQLNLELKDE